MNEARWYTACICLLAACVTGCATRMAQPVNVESTLLHGADSVDALDPQRFSFASTCLSGSRPLFWARYFNHSNLPERPARSGISFAASEAQAFKKHGIKLLPVFAQNRNNHGFEQGVVHGEVNARDLLNALGAELLRRHLASRPLYVVLNEETNELGDLSDEHYRGWVTGLIRVLVATGANAGNVRPIIYGNIRSPDSALLATLERLHANRAVVPYYGFWRVQVDRALQGPPVFGKAAARNCARLDSWNRGNDWDEGRYGPQLVRQYLIEAYAKPNVSIDLNALNPKYASEIIDGMISFAD